MGLRPEAFEDAALADDSSHTVDVSISVVESMGSEKYLHFPLPDSDVTHHEAVRQAGIGENSTGMLVARVSPDSAAKRGASAKLAINSEKISIFAADSGLNLGVNH